MEWEQWGDHHEGMSVVHSNCKKFKRRGSNHFFNMTDYRSCENCMHYTQDRKCRVNQTEKSIFQSEMW